ncbi:MAG: glycosyltransferase [Thermoplasmata archaeon]
MPNSVVLYSEPLLSSDFTQYNVVAPLARSLARDFAVSIVAPSFGTEVAAALRQQGLTPIDLGARFPPIRTSRDEIPSFMASWGRDALLGANARRTEAQLRGLDPLRVNFSMTNSARSDIWYVQGRPLGPSLLSVLPNLGGPVGFAARLAAPSVGLIDRRHFRRTAARSARLYTACRSLADWYGRQGLPIEGQVPTFLPYPFEPTTANPRRDYALAYLGKETDMAAIRELMDTGIPLRLFGGKSADYVRRRLGREPPDHVESLGFVSHATLAELYSHALFTAFPFTEEPFGLVPVESMACGTPVLTYRAQGPGETVLDGITGWLVPGRAEFVLAARRIFARGYPTGMPAACRRQAANFRLETVAHRWTEIFRACLDGREPPAVAPAPPLALGELDRAGMVIPPNRQLLR